MYASTATTRICFGGRGESKLIVLMSFGASALSKWQPGPSPDSDAGSSQLHHGDLLVSPDSDASSS